jgi:hypothetical protein
MSLSAEASEGPLGRSNSQALTTPSELSLTDFICKRNKRILWISLKSENQQGKQIQMT